MAKIDLSDLPGIKTIPPVGAEEAAPTPTPVPEMEPVPTSTPVLGDFSALDVLKNVQVKPSQEELDQLKSFAMNKLLKDIPPEMKKLVVDDFIAEMKRSQRHIGDKQFFINMMHNVRDISLGVGELMGEGSKALYGMATGDFPDTYSQEIQKKAAEAQSSIQGYRKGTITLDDLKKRLATTGLLEPTFDDRGNIKGLAFVPTTELDKKFKKAAQTMFAPHIEAFKEISKGNLDKGVNILYDHYYDHPADFLLDASMVLSVSGAGLKGVGGLLKGAAKSGSLLGESAKLVELGAALEQAGNIIDPLQLSLRGTKLASSALLKSNPWGRQLLSWMGNRKNMRLIFAEGTTVMRERLIDSKDKIQEIFGPLMSGKYDYNMELAGMLPERSLELESFAANLEGLAQPIKGSEAFNKSLELYKQWIEIENKYLIGKKLLDSARHREVIFQPLMAATGLNLQELESFVRGADGIVFDNAGVAESINKTLKAEEVVSAEALQKAEEKSRSVTNERRAPSGREIDSTKIRPEVNEFGVDYIKRKGSGITEDEWKKLGPLNRDEERFIAEVIDEAASRRPPAPGQNVYLTPKEQEIIERYRRTGDVEESIGERINRFQARKEQYEKDLVAAKPGGKTAVRRVAQIERLDKSIKKLTRARTTIKTKPALPKDDLERAISESEGKPTSGVIDKVTTTAVDDAEDTVRIATVNPWAAEKMQRLNAEIGRWDDYASRIRNKVPTTELPVAPRAALVEELKILKRDFDQLVDQAKGELTHEIKIELGPELSRAEKAERGGVHRISKGSFFKQMRALNAPDTSIKSLWEMASGGAPIEAGSMEQSISKIAEDIGKERYAGAWESLDTDQRMLARDSIIEEVNEVIKDIRAPIQRGEKLQMTADTKERLTGIITKIHRTAFELDRYAPSGAPRNVLERAQTYTSNQLDRPVLNPKHGEMYEYKNKSGEVIRKPRQNPIWEKGDNKFKQYRRYVRRRNPVSMSKAEREQNLQTALTRINELRIEKKRLMEFEESVAAAYDPTFHTPKIETDADAIIAYNLESQAADNISIHAWMQGTFDKEFGPFNTPLQMDIKYATALEQSSHLVTEKKRALLAMYENDLDNILYERNRLVKRSGGYTFPKGVKTSEGYIDNKKLKVVLAGMEEKASALRKAGKPGAGKIEAQAREYRLHRSEYNANQKEIDGLIKQQERVKTRINELNQGESPKPGELRSDPTRLDTAPPSNLGEKTQLKPIAGEKAVSAGQVRLYRGESTKNVQLPDWIEQGLKESGAKDAQGRWYTDRKDIAEWYAKEAGETSRVVTLDVTEAEAEKFKVTRNPKALKFSADPDREFFVPKGIQMVVPKIAGGDGKLTKSANAIIADLSSMVRKDPDIMKALARVREYTTSRPGIFSNIGTGEQINISNMVNLLREVRVPKTTRHQIRKILDAYNEARISIPEAEGYTPFIVQQMFPKNTVTKVDLLKGSIKGTLEAKLTEPVYYPHVFERQVNVLDARNAEGKAILDKARAGIVDKTSSENFLRRELGRQGYTGFMDEEGKFHRITLGMGYRDHIRSVLGGKVQPAIRKPGFLKKRTGAWGYITNDPAAVLAQHRIEFHRFQRNIEIIDKIKENPQVAVWDGNNENLLKKGDVGPDGKIVAEDYVAFSFEGTQNYFVQNVKFKQIYMGAIKDSGVVMDDALLQAVLQKMPSDLRIAGSAQKITLHQIPKSMNNALIDNLKLDMPPLLLRMFDRATDFWRGMTLAFSPRWYINNIIGNSILSAMGGVSPLSFIQSKMKMFDDIYPNELMTTGLVFTEASERSLKYSSAKAFSRLYDLNQNIENFYRRAAYFDKATKLARKELMSKTTFGFYNSNEMLEQLKLIKKDPALRNRVMDQVHEFLFDYSRMDPLERTWIRRIIPFWSWYKNIGKNFYLMPLKHPKRAFVMKTLAEIGHDAVEQTFNEMGTEWNDIPAFLQGRVVIPGPMTEYMGKTGNPDVGLISTRSFNPYADVFNLPANILGPATGVYPGGEGRFPGINPLLKVGLEQTVARGTNLGTGEKYTSPDQMSTFSSGDVYIDPETGQSYQNTRVVPPILEHIMRQTPQWELIKDISYWIRFQKLGAEYGTSNIINPQFLIDHKTGELRYPKAVITSTLKLLGLNVAWLQNVSDLQARIDQTQSQAFAGKYNKLLAEDPKFQGYALEKVEDILNNKMSNEQRMDLFRKLIRKKPRSVAEKIP